MNRPFRRLLAVIVLAGGLAAPTSAAEVNPLLPAETETVIYVNFRQIIDSPLVRKMALEPMKKFLQGEDAQKVMTDLGLDPLKDVDELTAGFWADDPKVPRGLFILSGKFDPVKLFNFADAKGKENPDRIEIVTEGKYKFVHLTFETPEEDPRKKPPFTELFVSVPSNAMILAATDKDQLAKTMERLEKRDTKPAVKKPMGALLVKADAKASMFMCGLSDPKKIGDIPPNPLFPDPDGLKKQLEKMESTAMTLRIGDDIGLEVALGMKDADAADEFAGTIDDMVGKVKGFLPLIAGQAPQLKPVIDDVAKNLACQSKGKEVRVTLGVSGKAIAAATGAGD
jgi:hypothetical protein